MKKIFIALFCFVLVFAVASTVVLAKGKTGPAGKSNVAHLYLHEKDPSGDWPIIEDGAWGKMKYNQSGSEFEFVFNGHGLGANDMVEAESAQGPPNGGNGNGNGQEGVAYTLIYYPDPWPGDGLICLGSSVSNGQGNVHIEGLVDTGDLPIAGDKNNIDNPDKHEWINEDYNGAKIWLVLSADVDCENAEVFGWNPEEYLFEYDLIIFDDSD